MAGKPREERSTIAAHHLGLRLTSAEHMALKAIVQEEAAKLRAQGLGRIVVTQTAVVRMLIEQEAKRRGIALEPEPVEAEEKETP